MREKKFKLWDTAEKKMYGPFTFGDLYGYEGEVNAVLLSHPYGSDRTDIIICSHTMGSIAYPQMLPSHGINSALVFRDYIGQKDKSGTEIYEGDILLVRDTKWMVAWHRHENSMTGWMVKDSEVHHWYVIDESILSGKVIGDIYETPKLWKE